MRRGNPNRPYYDDMGGRSRGSSHHYQQPPRDGFSQQHHQQSGYWQDDYQTPNNDCRFGNQPPWVPGGQSFNQTWAGHGAGYQSQQSFWSPPTPSYPPQLRPPPLIPQNNSVDTRTKRCFSTSSQGSWEKPPPPPPPTPMFIDPPVAVNPPPGSKEEREKRLEESRERLMKSLKESKNEMSTTTKETISTSKPTSLDKEISKPEATKTRNEPGCSSNTSQHRRVSLESISLTSDPSSKTNKSTATASKRVRSTSFSSISSKKSDNQASVSGKGQDDLQIQDIKDQVIQQLLTLSQNKLQEIVSNPRSRKFEFVMKYMMKESRCEQAQKQRQLAEAGISGTNCDLVPLDYETLLSDPDLAVNLSNLPPEMIQTLGNIFNLKSECNDLDDLESDDYMNVNEIDSKVRDSDNKPAIIQESSDQSDLNKSNVMLQGDTFFQSESVGMFTLESDINATAVKVFDTTVTSLNMDFSMPMNLEDVNTGNSLASSANGFCPDSEDISSVLTAMEHSADSLTDSLEQIQFPPIPNEVTSESLAPPAVATATAGEGYEEKNIDFDLLPVEDNRPIVPTFEPMEDTTSFTEIISGKLTPEAFSSSENLTASTGVNVPSDQFETNEENITDPVIETPKDAALIGDITNRTTDQQLTPDEAPAEDIVVPTATLVSSYQPPTAEENTTSSVPNIETPSYDVELPAVFEYNKALDDVNRLRRNKSRSDKVEESPSDTIEPKPQDEVEKLPTATHIASPPSQSTDNITIDDDHLDKLVDTEPINYEPSNTINDNEPTDVKSIDNKSVGELGVNKDIEPNDEKSIDNEPVSKLNVKDNEPNDEKSIDSEDNEPNDGRSFDNEHIGKRNVNKDNEPNKDDDQVNQSKQGVEVHGECDPVIQPRAMVMIEQSMLDHENISVNDPFEHLRDSPILSPDEESFQVASSSNSVRSFAAEPGEGIVKLESGDISDVGETSDKRQTIPVEASTQTDCSSSNANNIDVMLNQIEHLCQDQALHPAFLQLKHLLSAQENATNVSSSSRSRQTKISQIKARTRASSSETVVISTATSSRGRRAAILAEEGDSVDSVQTMLKEIANKAVPKERLQLIFKKITEIEKKIETWTDMKKKLYEQVNSILKDEQSASSSQEDSEDVSPERSSRRAKTQPVSTKRQPPTVRELSVSVDRLNSKSILKPSLSRGLETISVIITVPDKSMTTDPSADDSQMLPNKAPSKKKRRLPYTGSSKKKKRASSLKGKDSSSSSVAHKFTPPRSSPSVKESPKSLPLKAVEVVVPRSRTPSRASPSVTPASNRRSLRSAPEVVVVSSPTSSMIRKTKAELKQMVHDPIESDSTPPSRKTRTSRAASESFSPEELPQTEGRRVTRHQLMSEPAEEKVTPPPPRLRKPGPASRRSKRHDDDDNEVECKVVYTKMTMKKCSVVLEPLKQPPAKKPRLTVKTDLFDDRNDPETIQDTSQDESNDDEASSSDDDVPLLKLSKPSKGDTGEVPIPTAFDMWMRKEDGDQVSVSSCDTGTTSIDPRTDDGEAITGTSSHKSKKRKSKKSKSRCEEHYSSKNEQLIFTDHQRGAILEIKVCNRQVLAASEEGLVFNYSFKSGKLKKTYSGHTAAITCFCLLDNEEGDEPERLITGSLDEYSRSFVLKSEEESHSPLKVGAAVSIDQKWGTIFLGTKLGEVVKIDAKTFTVVGEHMKFSKEAILALKATKEGPRRVLIVGTRNQAITVRDSETGLLLRSVSGTGQHTVYSLLLHKSLVYCGTMQGTIPVFDFTSGVETCRFIAGNGVRCIKVYYGLLFAGCYDGFIYVFNVHDQRLITKIPGTGKMILCMDIAKNKIIFSCKDSFQVLNFPPDVTQALKDAKSK